MSPMRTRHAVKSTGATRTTVAVRRQPTEVRTATAARKRDRALSHATADRNSRNKSMVQVLRRAIIRILALLELIRVRTATATSTPVGAQALPADSSLVTAQPPTKAMQITAVTRSITVSLAVVPPAGVPAVHSTPFLSPVPGRAQVARHKCPLRLNVTAQRSLQHWQQDCPLARAKSHVALALAEITALPATPEAAFSTVSATESCGMAPLMVARTRHVDTAYASPPPHQQWSRPLQECLSWLTMLACPSILAQPRTPTLYTTAPKTPTPSASSWTPISSCANAFQGISAVASNALPSTHAW